MPKEFMIFVMTKLAISVSIDLIELHLVVPKVNCKFFKGCLTVFVDVNRIETVMTFLFICRTLGG